MPNTKQEKEFSEELNQVIDTTVSRNALDVAIEWIKANMQPEDVFEKGVLLEYARTYDPEDVFPVKGRFTGVCKNIRPGRCFSSKRP